MCSSTVAPPPELILSLIFLKESFPSSKVSLLYKKSLSALWCCGGQIQVRTGLQEAMQKHVARKRGPQLYERYIIHPCFSQLQPPQNLSVHQSVSIALAKEPILIFLSIH